MWGMLIACCLQVLVARDILAQVRETHPTEAGNVIDAVPRPGSIIPYGVPQAWFDLKDDGYDWIGLRYGFRAAVAVPSNFGIADVGGITTNVEFTSWSFAIENLYREQWLREAAEAEQETNAGDTEFQLSSPRLEEAFLQRLVALGWIR